MPATGTLKRLWIDAQEWGLAAMDGLRSGKPVGTSHLATGLRGEHAALFELRRRGFVIVARRWTNPRMRGDVDLIGWDGDQLCFVEVKTRTARDMTPAEGKVDEDKCRMLRGLAGIYLRSFPEQERGRIPVRFDIVSVYLVGRTTEFEFFEGAFGWR